MFNGSTDLGWYINFQAPIARGDDFFDTVDYGIDIVIPPDGPWSWKDFDDIDDQVVEGRISAALARDIRLKADDVAADLEADRRWWSAWDDWQP